MADPRFYSRAGPFRLGKLAGEIGAEIGAEASRASPDLLLNDVAPIEAAGPGELTFCADKRFRAALAATRAGACLVHPEHAPALAAGTVPLLVENPAGAYALASALFYPVQRGPSHIAETALVHPAARLGEAVSVEPYAVIGPGAEIGRGTVIGAGSQIGPGCAIGMDCLIGPNVTIAFSLIGDRVIVHPGARIGQDGFGLVGGAGGRRKIPQLGRVVIQDDVEIGANTTIDRGAGPDTVIGQGTKIDNLVQIGHNTRIGRHCVIAGQVGISGSTVIGDFVALGGKAGLADHVMIGNSAQVAALSGVMRDIPPGEIHMGIPARPIKEFMRETAILTQLARKKKTKDD
jgi:UDP-3-O-[3-hydroxymyristoyl] glucosamine N-acyltransferase